jgi:hypothetical protein
VERQDDFTPNELAGGVRRNVRSVEVFKLCVENSFKRLNRALVDRAKVVN